MHEVDLPLQPSASVSSDTAARILVIDDEAAIRESLEVLLTLEGYSVQLTIDGEDGLRALDQDNYDLVLLDLALPGQSGMELLPQIKERLRHRGQRRRSHPEWRRQLRAKALG